MDDVIINAIIVNRTPNLALLCTALTTSSMMMSCQDYLHEESAKVVEVEYENGTQLI